MDFLRTPEERFTNLPDYDFSPQYLEIMGGRMHYIDTHTGAECLLMLHGEPSWVFLYRHIINTLKADFRCIAPDMLGFGRSDKPTKLEDHNFDFHYQALSQFIEKLDLREITLIVQDWGGLLGLPYAAHNAERIKRLVIMNTGLATGDVNLGDGFRRWQNFVKRVGTKMEAGQIVAKSSQKGLSPELIAAYDAPFPDESYRAGIAAMPLHVPTQPDMGGAALSRSAREIFAKWEKPCLVMFSDKDPVTANVDKFFRKLIPTAKEQPEIIIHGAGHFLQEEAGELIAGHIRDFMARTS